MITPRLEYRNLEFYEVHKVSILIIIISKSLQLALILSLPKVGLMLKIKQIDILLKSTPKVRQKKI